MTGDDNIELQAERLNNIKRPSAHVYVIGLRDGEKTMPYTKVGISGDIERRVRSMSTSLPFDIFVHASAGFKTRAEALGAEADIHEKLGNLRIRGEWFAGDPSVHLPKIREVVSHIERRNAPASRGVNTRPSEGKPKKLFKYEQRMIENGLKKESDRRWRAGGWLPKYPPRRPEDLQ